MEQFFNFTAPSDLSTTLHAAPGKTAVLDGAGTLRRALTAVGLLNLFGQIVVRNYAPTSTSNGSNAPVYFGGTSAGSEVDGLSVSRSTMAGLGFQNRVILRRVTIEDCGYSGIMGTMSDGALFEDVLAQRVNRNNRPQDGQLDAVKLTWSTGVVVSGYQAYDVPNGAGFWLDAGCQDSDLADFAIDGAGTDGVSSMQHGVIFEISQGGTLARAIVKGATSAGVMVASAGGVSVTDSDLRGNFVGVWLKQEPRTNTDAEPRNGTPAENPWRTVGHGC